MNRPLETDYAPSFQSYVNKVDGNDIIQVLEKQHKEMRDIMSSISEEQSAFAYEPGKWSIKELLGHVVDSERIFAYRALCIARGETISLPGYEQDDYVKEADFKNRGIASLADEYKNLRASNIILFKSFPDEVLNRRGTANNYSITVRALLFIIAGHEKHHIDILKERYLKN